MSGASELEPCPFCGGKAYLSSYSSCDCCGKAYNGCVTCSGCGNQQSHYDSDAEAIEAWNRRVAADELSRLSSAHSEAVEDARKHLAGLRGASERVAGLEREVANLIQIANLERNRADFAKAELSASRAEVVALREALARIGRRARSDGNRTFDDTIRDLEWIDDECRRVAALAGEKPVGAGVETLRRAAERVVWFDWSDNDSDAVAAIDALAATLSKSGEKP